MIKIPGMIMIGAGDRNVGKTEFACSLIRKFGSQHNIIGIKVTTIEHANAGCHRGAGGCGVCGTLESNFCITEETNSQPDKDTCRMLSAGAKKVYWLRVLKPHLKEGVIALQAAIGADAVCVCESNSLRSIVEPDLFFMFKAVGSEKSKPTAASVEKHADRTVLFDGSNFDITLDDIELIDGKWVYKMPATAVIMAGGKSRRMGKDKSILPINGIPAIEHIFAQLRPHFDQILVSSNNIAQHSIDGVEVVKDEAAGKGPLMGIASALRVSRNQINFVIACDIPDVNISLVRHLIRECAGFDAVIPQTGPSHFEPMFAIYSKDLLVAIDESISLGKYKILEPLKKRKVKYLKSPDALKLKNLNTMNDYLHFLKEKKGVAG
ncbi:MAG: molybdenum cofactor guanylyltransferase [Planctomycetes bacterium]|nr:molybdenum cofactor guanylyltransferase [Planctomycetota bacterium]